MLCAIAGLGVLVWLLAGAFPGSLERDIDQAGLLRTVAILLLVAAGVVFAPRFNLKGAAKHAVIWGAIIVALLAVYAIRNDVAELAARIGGELVPGYAVDAGEGAISVKRSDDGHFHLIADVNGTRVRFLVDTGASVVTLSPGDAARAGIDPDTLDYVQTFRTASGTAAGAPVRLDSITAGPLKLRDVRGAVIKGGGSSLLGMSFLSRLESFSINGDTLTLTQ